MATILVVDDHPTNREFFTTLLSYQGHRLLEAADGAEALALARAERPDLIISDILMPTMDGFELVRHLRTDLSLGSTRVIFSTAHFHELEANALARECGVAFILPKPCEPETVLHTVEAVLNLGGSPAPLLHVDAFDREHRQLLTDQLARKAEQLRIVNRRLNTLLELSPRLVAESDPLRLLEAYCRAAREIIGAKYAAVGVLSEAEPALRHFFVSGVDARTAANLRAVWPWQDALDTILKDRRPCRRQYARGESLPLCPPDTSPPMHSFLGVPLTFQSQVYGWLCLVNKLGAAAFDIEDERLAVMLAAHIAVAYENAQRYDAIQRYATKLHEEIEERQRTEAALQETAQSLQALSRRLVEVQEQERRDIARELHDEIGQLLTGVKLSLDIGQHLPASAMETNLVKVQGLVNELIARVRNLSLALRPTMLDDFGLLPALLWHIERYTAQSHVQVLFEHHGLDRRFAPEVETAAYRIVQEALTNVARHANVSEATVHLWTHHDTLVVQIADAGKGCDPAAAYAARHTGGVTGMRERAVLLGGRLILEAAPGEGTTVRAELPLQPLTGRS